jgi:oxygen-independent coproporphyrinogen-3 oxidase
MCYYCGCNVAIRKANANVGLEYISYIEKELTLLLSGVTHRPQIKQLHLGGGTPNFLTSDELRALKNLIDRTCDIDPDAEVAIEVDPRTVTEDQIITLKDIGFNRISMGIQDFSEPVQEAINRHQSIELVTQLFKWIRSAGFPSINVDLIYGLPHQTVENFSTTVDEIIRLSPERIALYSYAHVPWLKSHQSLIPTEALPGQDDKLGIFLEARRLFLNSGYDAIGMDHFAKSSDELALAYHDGVLHRNFMGYTVKPATEYLGIGVSSIGFISGHFVQSTKDLKKYYADLDDGRLPLERGLELSQDDHIRQWVIQSLMCHFKLDKEEFFSRYHVNFDLYFSESMSHLKTCESQGLIELTDQGIRVTQLGRLFVRNVAMGFDAYLKQNSERRFSRTV